jgi:hypothetical protein
LQDQRHSGPNPAELRRSSKEEREVWGYLGIVLLLPAAAVLVWLFDPHLRRGRTYQAELQARAAVSDGELVARFFEDRQMAAVVAVRVRRVFAEQMGYQADRLLPDDDFGFFWAELDAAPLFEALEREFAIVIDPVDAEATPPTIRLVTELVHRLRAKQSAEDVTG